MVEDKKDISILEDKDSKAVQELSKLIDPEVIAQVYKEHDSLAKAFEKFQTKFDSPFLSGARDLIDDDDLDTHRLFNEAKYLHLLLAVFGFQTLGQELLKPEQKEEIENE